VKTGAGFVKGKFKCLSLSIFTEDSGLEEKGQI